LAQQQQQHLQPDCSGRCHYYENALLPLLLLLLLLPVMLLLGPIQRHCH
jgi:hypothetical protein